jgi:hypothetical protein
MDFVYDIVGDVDVSLPKLSRNNLHNHAFVGLGILTLHAQFRGLGIHNLLGELFSMETFLLLLCQTPSLYIKKGCFECLLSGIVALLSFIDGKLLPV